VGYFEDVQDSMENMNRLIPMEFARKSGCTMIRESDWRDQSRTDGGVGEDHTQVAKIPAGTAPWGPPKQGRSLKDFCAIPETNVATGHSSRLAEVEGIYFAKTGDIAYRKPPTATYKGVTYFQGPRGEHTRPSARSGGLPMNLLTDRAG